MSYGDRLQNREFSLVSENGNPTGIACHLGHAYIADNSDRYIYVYELATGTAQHLSSSVCTPTKVRWAASPSATSGSMP